MNKLYINFFILQAPFQHYFHKLHSIRAQSASDGQARSGRERARHDLQNIYCLGQTG